MPQAIRIHTQGVIEANVVTAPRIRRLLRDSDHFVARFHNVSVERKIPIVETSSHGTVGAVVLSHIRHSAALLAGQRPKNNADGAKVPSATHVRDGVVNRLQSLMLAHVLSHFRMRPACIIR